MYNFITTSKTDISKARRIVHNRTPLDILCFLEVSFQIRFLHFHYVAHQCRSFPSFPVSKMQSEQQPGPETYSCTEHRALTIVSFTNLGKPIVFQTTSLIWGAKQKIMNVLKYSTLLHWGWIEDEMEMQLTKLVAAKDPHL